MSEDVGRYQLCSPVVVANQDGQPIVWRHAWRFDSKLGIIETIDVPRPEEPKIKPARILDLGTGGMPS